MRKFFSDFKKFITRGNVVDMAIGVIVASAFTAIVTALTNGIIMPFINYLLSLGGTGLDSAYTFLKKVVDETTGTVDLANSIYIDWGTFITAIINFLLVAFVLFCILRIFMRSRGFLQKQIGELPTHDERKQLKEMGVNLKNRHEVIEKTAEIRANKKKEEEEKKRLEHKPTTEELLADIKVLLENQNKNK